MLQVTACWSLRPTNLVSLSGPSASLVHPEPSITIQSWASLCLYSSLDEPCSLLLGPVNQRHSTFTRSHTGLTPNISTFMSVSLSGLSTPLKATPGLVAYGDDVFVSEFLSLLHHAQTLLIPALQGAQPGSHKFTNLISPFSCTAAGHKDPPLPHSPPDRALAFFIT